MFAYSLELAGRSFRKNRVLTALIVLAIALGIGASMTTLTVFHVLSGDPIPQKSDRLFYVQLDAEGRDVPSANGEPTEQLTRFDSEALLREKRGDRQAMMSAGHVVAHPAVEGRQPLYVETRFTSADFFPMFDVPFVSGRGWSAAEDEGRARVAVISKRLAEKLFGDASGSGRTLRLDDSEFQVVGVIDDWRPVPHFYDLTTGRYAQAEQVFLPFSTSRDLAMRSEGSTQCWSDEGGDSYALNAACAWVQYWVELGTPAKTAEYRQYLKRYSEAQQAAGRFERPPNARLRSVMDWLDYKRVVPSDVRLQVWLAFGFLLVCLVNAVGLLLAKCLRRAPEIGVRRALGASRRAIFVQFVVEAGWIGAVGGVLGLGIALLGLWGVRQNPAAYAQLAQLDVPMLVTTLCLAVGASLVAGLLPAWHACRVMPALQLKSQ